MYFKVVPPGYLEVLKQVEIDSQRFRVQLERANYQVSSTKDHKEFLIDFGINPSIKHTIVCDNPGEMIIALALVRQALDK